MAQVITNAELTTAQVDGTGAFDLMMQAAKAHLEQEFKANRIKGAEYAQVYLGVLTAVMQNATQFLLGQLNADENALLIQAQIAKLAAEKDLVTAQQGKVQAEINLVQMQAELAQLELVNVPKQGALLDAQTGKTNQETTNLIAQELIIPKQGDKLDSEVSLLDQRKFSEEAQILDTVNGATVSGVIGKQKGLYQAQTDGFSRDAEHKLAKLMADVWSVQRTTDEGITPAGAGITDSEIKKVIDRAKEGIGVVPG